MGFGVPSGPNHSRILFDIMDETKEKGTVREQGITSALDFLGIFHIPVFHIKTAQNPDLKNFLMEN